LILYSKTKDDDVRSHSFGRVPLDAGCHWHPTRFCWAEARTAGIWRWSWICVGWILWAIGRGTLHSKEGAANGSSQLCRRPHRSADAAKANDSEHGGRRRYLEDEKESKKDFIL
jgi:hypothetical protein